jgi:hypothetical protein
MGGHAEDEVRTRPEEAAEERPEHVGGVVHGAQAEAGALEGGRPHPHDLDPVSELAARPALVPADDAGEDAHLVLVGERLAELSEKLRRRLHPRPVVLVENEEARPRRP